MIILTASNRLLVSWSKINIISYLKEGDLLGNVVSYEDDIYY